MSSILNIGTRALQANQVALQTAGNNIANVNTPGYSRQSVVLQAVEGQYTGAGYIGKGVEVQTIQRNYSAFLTTSGHTGWRHAGRRRDARRKAESARRHFRGRSDRAGRGHQRHAELVFRCRQRAHRPHGAHRGADPGGRDRFTHALQRPATR